jgi:hypothetical protein
VLLYAASDLHDAAKVAAKSSTLNGYSNKELVMYAGSQTARIQAAKAAAKAVLDGGSRLQFEPFCSVSPENLEVAIQLLWVEEVHSVTLLLLL